jgi:hypothetical protein
MGNRHCLYLIPEQDITKQTIIEALVSFIKETDDPWTETEKISIQVPIKVSSSLLHTFLLKFHFAERFSWNFCSIARHCSNSAIRITSIIFQNIFKFYLDNFQ